MEITSYVLVNLSPVVDLIFSYLSGKSLCNAAQVCSSWYSAKKREIKKREWWDSGLVSASNYLEEVQMSVKTESIFNELRFQPSLILALKSLESETLISLDDFSFFQHSIPKKCSVLSAHVGGVIGRKKDKKKTKNIEIEYKNAISFLCLGPSKDLDFKKFFISKKDIQKIKSKDINFFNLVGGLDLSSEINTVILLFATTSPKIKRLVEQIKKHSGNNKVILVGGYTDDVNDSSASPSSLLDSARPSGIMGVVFSGEKLNVGLHIKYDNSKEILKDSLTDVKNDMIKDSKRKIDWDKSLIFIVSCVGRGEYYYRGEQNAETAVVEKVFPGLTTFGFFGLGEIGFDSKDTGENDSCNFSLTSVFCVINYG